MMLRLDMGAVSGIFAILVMADVCRLEIKRRWEEYEKRFVVS